VWGSPDSGGANAPTDKGYIKIYSTAYSFVVLFIGTVQKLSKLPHDVIEPSALRAAKALSVE
jgi:hypothetical protein